MENCLNIVGRRSRFKEWRFLFPLIIFFFFYISCCHNAQILSESMRLLTTEADDTFYKNLRNETKVNNGITLRIEGARKLLGGPGSSPPQCTSKCDGCTPCEPVLVPVQPGIPVAIEYYPEVWMCKCGIKFYCPNAECLTAPAPAPAPMLGQ